MSFFKAPIKLHKKLAKAGTPPKPGSNPLKLGSNSGSAGAPKAAIAVQRTTAGTPGVRGGGVSTVRGGAVAKRAPREPGLMAEGGVAKKKKTK